MDNTKPRLEITIQLDNDDPTGLHSFLGELPWFGVVGGWDNFDATIIESDGRRRDGKAEAYDRDARRCYIDSEDN